MGSLSVNKDGSGNGGVEKKDDCGGSVGQTYVNGGMAGGYSGVNCK